MREQRYFREEDGLPVNHDDEPLTAAEIMAKAWISVDEALPKPEDGDWVLGVATGTSRGVKLKNAIAMVFYVPERKEWTLEEFPFARVQVSHWMPLPDLPEVQDG